MSDTVAVEAVGAVGIVLVAIIGLLGTLLGRRQARTEDKIDALAAPIEATRDNLQNGHASYLRDDIDLIGARVAQVERDVRSRDETILAEIRGLRKDIGRIGDRDNLQAAETLALREDIARVEARITEYEK